MKYKSLWKIEIVVFIVTTIFNCKIAFGQSNPNATAEAKALLDLHYRISGKYTLTGQHNYPNTKDRNSRFAAKFIGQTPVIWSTDMGFAKPGDTDTYLARPDIVKEAIRQHRKGSIITICWHAVPPTADEPVTFNSRGPVNPDSLSTVQGQLLDQQFKDVLTPGTKLYKRWAAQVDSIAVYLKKLQDARVPILWRPYHEMNGKWFWWGGRVGQYSTADLYKQLYDRLVNYHKLNNLVWVWNVDRPNNPIMKFSNFYPGDNYLDIASLDVYGSDFQQVYYDSLLVLAKGKPILFGEVGNPPTSEVLKKQPKWTSWVIWAGMARNTTKKQYQELINNPRMLFQEKPAYWEVIAPYRKACGLALLPIKPKYPVSFSGKWVLNGEKSEFGDMGIGNSAAEMDIDQDDDLLMVKKLTISEWGDDKISNDEIFLDGTEMISEFFNTPRISKASWDSNSKTIVINSVVKFNRDGNIMEFKSNEIWSIEEGVKILKIAQTSTSFRGGENKATLIYNKK
jgi:mannan endo-1,4-beta-mannosidase